VTNPPHRFETRVYWEDTDASGIVYHASYLRFAERGRTELLRGFGIGQAGMLEASGIAFVVRTLTIDYRRPARLDDLLGVETRITALAGATLQMVQEVRHGDAALATLTVTLACIRRDGRPARIPPQIRESFAALAG
jgi:acyl-CoA thioester hydrolase